MLNQNPYYTQIFLKYWHVIGHLVPIEKSITKFETIFESYIQESNVFNRNFRFDKVNRLRGQCDKLKKLFGQGQEFSNADRLFSIFILGFIDDQKEVRKCFTEDNLFIRLLPNVDPEATNSTLNHKILLLENLIEVKKSYDSFSKKLPLLIKGAKNQYETWMRSKGPMFFYRNFKHGNTGLRRAIDFERTIEQAPNLLVQLELIFNLLSFQPRFYNKYSRFHHHSFNTFIIKFLTEKYPEDSYALHQCELPVIQQARSLLVNYIEELLMQTGIADRCFAVY